MYLGSDRFIERVKEITRQREWRDEHSKLQRDVRRIPIEKVRECVARQFGIEVDVRNWRTETPRFVFAILARDLSIATLREIGTVLTLTPSGVSRLLARADVRRKESNAFQSLLTALQLEISHAKIKV